MSCLTPAVWRSLNRLGLLELFELEHFAFAAIGAVASDKLWMLICGQALEQSFQARSPIRGAVPVARLQLGIEHQTQVAYLSSPVCL